MLSAAGLDPTAYDPRSFALNSFHQPIVLRVIGEGDGSFDAGEFSRVLRPALPRAGDVSKVR
jgi:hypothetical protein